jgi:hypothetical protein
MDPTLARLAAAAMGAPQDPAAAAQQPQGQPQMQPQGQPAAAPQPQRAPTPETAEGQAQTAGAPQTEGDKSSAAAVIYEIDMPGGAKRKFTPTQIAGMADRYSSLNHEHSQLKPVVELAKEMLRRNPGMTAQDLTETILSLAQAQQKNPTMGNGANTQQAAQLGLPDDDSLTKWEQENAASLPPGYREFMGQQRTMQSMLGQQTSLLNRLLAQAGGVAEGSAQAMQQAQSQVVNARQQAIGANLDRAQMELQIPSQMANPFMVWAAERGYTMEDFIDADMTRRVMRDFRNDLMAGEVDRLQSIHQKRQAFTGTVGQQPTGGNAAPADASKADFDSFASRQMAKRGIGSGA